MMFCIVHIVGGEITGWVIAPDRQTLSGRCYALDDAGKALSQKIDAMNVGPGKYDLGDGYTLLVE